MSIASHIARPAVTDRNPTGRASSAILRGVAVVLLLLLAMACATVFLLALGLLPPSAVVAAFAPAGDLLHSVATLDFVDRAIAGAAAAAVGVAALALMVRAPRNVPHAATKHILHADEKGLVVIGSESVETVAEQAAVRAPGVLDARVRVKGRPSGPVRLRVRVEVLPGTDVKRVGPRVQDAVRSSVEDLVGLTVRDANVEVHVMDPDDLAEVM